MMYQWTDRMISFMDDASRNSLYFSELADFLVPYLENCKTICDAGCGLGQLSAELGKRGFTVYACDVSEAAINYVKKQSYENVIPVVCDLCRWIPEKKFDAMIFNYFGSMEQVLEISSRCCRGKSLTLKKNYKSHRFSLSDQPIHGHMAIRAEEYLREKNIPFKIRTFEAELGQPFRNIREAVEFFEIYSHDTDRSLINEENVMKLLTPSRIEGYRFYLPQKKPSILIITEENND